ncbi:MAG TPA: CPBP family glutamic-type intramembrane protease [Symbiobacteriaceae bacterium]|nr:CPBP family glutamic-type intramembrane protease [Symbiobacteriaceae bacterium]
MSPYWRAVWEVALFLLGVSLLTTLTGMLLGFLAFGPLVLVVAVLQSLVPIVGTLVYLDWRWGWRVDTIGLIGGRHLRWLPAGLGLGALALVLTHGLGILLGGPVVPVLDSSAPVWLAVGPALISVLSVELLFRGGATARLQADLAPKEALWTALALPLVASWLSGSLISVPSGIHTREPWTLFFTAALTLLYLRTGSLWLNLGLSAVVMVLPLALGLFILPQAALLLWVTVAVILLIMAWRRVDRMPRRVGPQRQRMGRR